MWKARRNVWKRSREPACRPGGCRVKKTAFARAARLCLAVVLLCLGACGGRRAPSGAGLPLALDGPPLALVGEYEGVSLEGSMDRACMVGVGAVSLRAAGGEEFSCAATVDAPPTEKGRVRGIFLCTGERRLPFVLRNTGPDQGLGVAREPDHSGLLVFFYHVSREEALRRLPGVTADIAAARRAQ
jgi:hypothetical protein